MADETITVGDLADAYILSQRHAAAAEPVRAYHARRLSILVEVFGLDLYVLASRSGADAEERERSKLAWIALAAVQRAGSLSSPFPAIHEDGPGVRESALRARFEVELARRIEEVCSSLRHLLVDALVALEPALGARTFSADAVFARGLPRSAPALPDLTRGG